jgi:molecular chaperone DnaJ
MELTLEEAVKGVKKQLPLLLQHHVMCVMVKVLKIQMMLKLVKLVMVQVKCVCSKVSSLYNKLVAPVVAKAKLLKTHAMHVMVQVLQIVSKH